MSTESYVDSVRLHLAEREAKVRTVVDILRRIVRNHAMFDDANMGSPMGTPAAQWKEGKPNEEVWFSLCGEDGKQIDRAYAEAMEHRDNAVGLARFQFSVDDNPDFTAMTVEVRPPNVKGYDGSPLTSLQLDGAIADIRRYEDALTGE